jgi:hypothetical protein
MNERIKLLALQAGITDNNLSDGDMSLTDLEKFSELIVRECAHVALMSNGNNLHVCELIKKHFGVEE